MTAIFKFPIYSLQFTIKLFLILLVFIFTFYILHFTLLKSAYAQSPTPSALPTLTPIPYPLPPSISPTSPLYTDLLVNNMFHTFSCLALGQSLIGQPCLTYQITQNAQGILQGVPVLSQVNLSGGALGTVASLIGGLYMNPPVRTADYLTTVGHGLGIAKEVRAQGVVGSGQAVLSPIVSLWQVSRNISYVIMIIIFVVIGLMVMFRNRINPQTVITAQTALPGLVIGLILITFSYFLAGFISDMAFIGTDLVGYYFQAAQGIDKPASLVQKAQGESVLSAFGKFTGIVTKEDAADALASIFNSLPGEVQNYLRIFAGVIAFQFGGQIGNAVPVVGAIVGPIFGLISALTIQTNITGILGFFFSLIAVAILIYTMFRLLLRLVTTYLNIIFLTVTAPFQFLAASLPGRQGIATGWFLNMLCHVLAFPAVMAVFYFVNFLLGRNAITNSPFTVITSQPSLAGSQSFPLLGGMDLSFLRIVVAFGALLATPAIPDIICRAVGRTSQAGQLIGQQIGGGISGGRGYFGQVTGGAGRGIQSLGTSVFGETQYQIKDNVVTPWTTKPGLRHLPKLFGGKV